MCVFCSTNVFRFPLIGQIFKDKSPLLVSDGKETPAPFVAHMFYLSRRNNEKLADFGEDKAVMTGEWELTKNKVGGVISDCSYLTH